MAFFDYDILLMKHMTVSGERFAVSEASVMRGPLPTGSSCIIAKVEKDGEFCWVRRTINRSQKGSTRYAWHRTEAEAMTAGQNWAARKFAESLRLGRPV
jgi:hypothetical protein